MGLGGEGSPLDHYIVDEITHYCNISVSRCVEIRERRIDFYDLTFVLSGSMTYVADGQTYVLRRNDALFLKPGTLRCRLAGDEPVKYASFNFQVRPGWELSFAPHIPNCISSDVRKLVSVFPQSHLSSYYHSADKVANMLNYILFELLDVTQLKCSNEHVLKIIRYVDENLTEKMTLNSISKQVSLSKEYISYMFKKEMGKPLTDYINEKKILLAKELILNGEMPLTDIAAYLGYSSYNYFSRLFKRYFDLTPTALKKRK